MSSFFIKEKACTVLGVFVDLNKALATFDHNILLKKVNFDVIYGKRGIPCLWFENYEMVNSLCLFPEESYFCEVRLPDILGFIVLSATYTY